MPPNLKRLSASVNPFLSELFNYPGLIFPGFNIDEDINLLRTQFDKYEDIILEFGSGSGEHLIGLALLFPKSLVIGFEIRFKRAVRTLEKAQLNGITNLRVFRGRADTAPKIFESQTSKNINKERKISQIYINFPDPWEKKRWLKHRILTKDSINLYLPLLKPDGIFSIKTDHEEYFDSFMKELSTMSVNILELTKDLNNSDFPSANIKTEFEQLFRSQNKKINYVRFSAHL